MLIQKNIDHHPGTYDFFLHNQPGSPVYVRQLANIPDTSAPAIAFYYVNVQIPTDVDTDTEYFLQVVYNTNIPTLKYYQCADIYVIE